MKIRIFQINIDRDENHRCFRGYDELPMSDVTGEAEDLDSGIYDLVFEGDVDCKNLEDVYRMFNLNHPAGYRGRSLSVSDVVEVQHEKDGESTYHYCDTFGYHQVDFDPDRSEVSSNFLRLDPDNQIRVLLVQPGKYPKEIKIDGSLESMQSVVGGDIEEYMPFDDEVAIICNEEGKLLGLPLNRAIYDETETEMSYPEMKELFREQEKSHGKHLEGYIVFSADSFTTPYPEASRTYRVSSDNKAFYCTTGGYSIFGDSLDGSDRGVRLDYYMADERGGKDGWKIERCYMKENEKEIIEVMAGDFFLAYAPIEAEHFQSLPDDLMAKYREKFKFPERFAMTVNGIVATPFRPQRDEVER